MPIARKTDDCLPPFATFLLRLLPVAPRQTRKETADADFECSERNFPFILAGVAAQREIVDHCLGSVLICFFFSRAPFICTG